jgi:tRNA-specific 2-thiouridylase
MYVVDIRPDTREVVIGTGNELWGHALSLSDVNWLADPLAVGAVTMVQCRYRAAAVPATVAGRTGGGLDLRLARPVRAITPGQSGVLYDETGRLLGGGLIA